MSNNRGLTLERQSSDFAIADGGRQESVLEPGFVRAPRDMKPPTPIEWGRGDSLLWDQRNDAGIDKSTPLGGYGRDKDLFADAVATISPTQPGADSFPPPRQAGGGSVRPPAAAMPAEAGKTFAAILSGGRLPAAPANTSNNTNSATTASTTRIHPSGDNNMGGGHPMSASDSGAFGGSGGGHGRRQTSFKAEAGGAEPSAVIRQRTSDLEFQYRTQSQLYTDELHHQCKTFPPPPPILAPGESRRNRAARWYYFAMKWDITHEQPPPPRTPLPLMDQEKEMPSLRADGPAYPYRGDEWLMRCEHWFAHIQHCFPYPGLGSRSQVDHMDPAKVMELAYLGE